MLKGPACPSCKTVLHLFGIRDHFACHACGAQLVSNYSTCSFVAGVAVFVLWGAVEFLAADYFELPRSERRLFGAVALIALSLAVLPIAVRYLKVFVSPVRFRGAESFEDAARSDPQPPILGSEDRPRVTSGAVSGAARLTAAQLASWRRGVEEFQAESSVGAMLVLLGLCGLGVSVFAAFGSPEGGAMLALLSIASIVGGHTRNSKLAARHLLCPHCGHYPAGRISLGTAIPLLSVRELAATCHHCGTALPLDP